MTFRYSDFVDYSRLDPVKRMALDLFVPTLKYPERLGIRVILETLGQTAIAFDFSAIGDTDWLLTSNIETLGTKNRVADRMYMRALRKKKAVADEMAAAKYYRGLGQDVVAMAVNDQVSIGSDVFAYHDIIACGNSRWFSEDVERTRELLVGYRLAADEGQFAIPQGDTPELPDILQPDTAELSGSSIGLVRPRSRLITGMGIKDGDVVFGLESSGPHSNGITKIRRIAESLPDEYLTPMGDGRSLGEACLEPTRLYARPVMKILDGQAEIHYIQPITGHGWAKICRAKGNFTYIIEKLPEPPLLFRRLIEWGQKLGFDVSNKENYYTWNMGVGIVLIAPAGAAALIYKVAREFRFTAYTLGRVVDGERRVVMPFNEHGKNVTYLPP